MKRAVQSGGRSCVAESSDVDMEGLPENEKPLLPEAGEGENERRFLLDLPLEPPSPGPPDGPGGLLETRRAGALRARGYARRRTGRDRMVHSVHGDLCTGAAARRQARPPSPRRASRSRSHGAMSDHHE